MRFLLFMLFILFVLFVLFVRVKSFRLKNKTALIPSFTLLLKAVKSLFSNKSINRDQINLKKMADMSNLKTTETLNSFSLNITNTLTIPQYSQIHPILQNIGNPFLKTIMKYKIPMYSYPSNRFFILFHLT